MTPTVRQIVMGRPPYAAYSFAFDAKNGYYKGSNGLLVRDPTFLPGYAYTRSGAKSEISASGVIIPFAANAPGIVPGEGFWSRASLTNVLVRSQEMDNISWTASNVSVTGNTTVAPDGTTTAETITSVTPTAAQRISDSTSSRTSGTIYCLPVFLKNGTQRYAQLAFSTSSHSATAYANFDLQSGVLGTVGAAATAVMQSCGNGWYRCSIYATANATTTASESIYFIDGPTAARGANSSSTGTTLIAWQAQTVVGTQPGPIILTTSAAATVGGDSLSFSDAPADEDQIFLTSFVVDSLVATNRPASWSDGTTSNRVEISSVTNIGVTITVGGVAQTVTNPASRTTGIGRNIVLVRRRAGAWSYGVKLPNGTVSIGTETAGSMPVMTAVKPGVSAAASGPANDLIESVYRRRGTFSDSDITAILTAA